MTGIEIIDVHCHMRQELMENPEEFTPEMLSQMLSECSHETKLVCDDGRYDAGVKAAESVRTLARMFEPCNGNMLGWIPANPQYLEVALEAIELGARQFGMKVIGEMVQYIEGWVTDEYDVLPIVKKAGDLDVAINFHAGGASHVEGLVHLAGQFPRTRFIMAHFGGRDWKVATRLVKGSGLSNIWIEIDMGNPSEVSGHSPEQIMAAIDAAGIDRIVFGSDFSLKPNAVYKAGNTLLGVLRSMKLKDQEIRKICSLNAREVLKLES